MIAIQDLTQNPDFYKTQMQKRGFNPDLVDEIIQKYQGWKSKQTELDNQRNQKNEFNKKIVNLSESEKLAALAEMKNVAQAIKNLEEIIRPLKEELDELIKKIPNVLDETVPLGKSDADNPVIATFGEDKNYDFEVKPYWELPVYQEFVSQEKGVKVMGSRGYYMHGKMANFQRALFDYALDIVLKSGFELFYVPLMLNSEVLTGTGHLPDFDGQQYEVNINENTNYYLIGSSEPSIMGYFMNSHLGKLDQPILATCWSSCFRKEAGSYGKDQQGILRVHQFEKVEMVAICKPEETAGLFQTFQTIVQKIYSGLGIKYQAVEVCSGDMPTKHRQQIDYEAFFPSQDKYREICSNGNASDYQNRGLKISYQNKDKKSIPWGLNCTAVTFRTGLAILEQFQEGDGRVKLPKVLADKMRVEYL